METLCDEEIELVSAGNDYGDIIVNTGTAAIGAGLLTGQPEIVAIGGGIAGIGSAINLLWR